MRGWRAWKGIFISDLSQKIKVWGRDMVEKKSEFCVEKGNLRCATSGQDNLRKIKNMEEKNGLQ